MSELQDARQDAFRVGDGLGFSVDAAIDLPPPDGADIGRFHTELEALFALIFERLRPGTTGDSPLAGADTVAEHLAEGWARVWFASGDRPAPITPLISHPWVRLEPDSWPVTFAAVDGARVAAQPWPDDESARSEASRWVRLVGADTQLAELRIRPDRGRGGRIRLGFHLNSELFLGPVDIERSAAVIERQAEHRVAFATFLEDVRWIYRPVFWSVTPADVDASFVDGDDATEEVVERVAARLLRRILSPEVGASSPALREHWLRSWADRLSEWEPASPALANVYAALEGGTWG